MDFRDANIVITGGRGFIGRALSERLVGQGARVTTLGRSKVLGESVGKSLVCDLTDADATSAMMRSQKPDVVFHLASHVLGARTPEVVLSTYHNNATSTVNLLLAALDQGCERVVLTGSLEEPEPDGQWPVPSSPYAAAKLAASAYGRMFAALYDQSIVNLRLFMVYGPGPQDLKKLVPYVINSLLSGERPELSSGGRLVDWVYLDDVIDAYLCAAGSESVAGETIDVGTGELTSVSEVVAMLYRLVGVDDAPLLGAVEERKLEQIRRADPLATRELMGWSPTRSLEQGLSATVDWFRTQTT